MVKDSDPGPPKSGLAIINQFSLPNANLEVTKYGSIPTQSSYWQPSDMKFKIECCNVVKYPTLPATIKPVGSKLLIMNPTFYKLNKAVAYKLSDRLALEVVSSE